MFSGRAMAFLIHLVVAVVTVFGVLLEMDVLVVPTHKVEYAKLPAAKTPGPAVPQAGDIYAVAPPPIPTSPSSQTAAQAVSEPRSDKCDMTACTEAYRSFRASDCTYQPDEGERRLCTNGVISDQAAAEAALNAHADVGAASAQCNVDACAHAYISFNRADCTYQPTEGPRRLCAKKVTR
jgi:BA14K-like protein